MTRVHLYLLVLSFGAILQGCASLSAVTAQPSSLPPLSVHLADSTVSSTATASASLSVPTGAKIVRFADALGAVASNAEASKLQSMLAAFDYCDREQRLAFVTPPMAYSPRINYSRVSTYSLRFTDEAASTATLGAPSYVAPFECIEQKHSVKTGLAESEDVPANALQGTMDDRRGGVIVHRTLPGSGFLNNDILVSVGLFRIETRGELAKAVDVSPVGDLSFGVVRGSKLVHVIGHAVDMTASTEKNALHLLEALCKETGASARSCTSHAFVAEN